MTESTTPGPGEPPRALVSALRRLLRPLVRLALVHGITLPFLTRELKAIYVDVAERDFPVPGKAPTDSRISLLTGIHRKDVRRLRGAPAGEPTAPGALSIGTQIIAAWVAEKRYLDRAGRPRALPLRGASARASSFEQLVQSVSRQDLRPRAVLDELLRLGIVEVEGERVRLNVEAFVPREGFDEKAFYFGQNLRDHIAAGAHNLDGGDPPMLDRSVFYHALGEQDVGELSALAEQLGMDALKTVNRRALSMKRRRRRTGDGRMRMNFGVFFYAAEDPSSSEDRADDE